MTASKSALSVLTKAGSTITDGLVRTVQSYLLDSTTATMALSSITDLPTGNGTTATVISSDGASVLEVITNFSTTEWEESDTVGVVGTAKYGATSIPAGSLFVVGVNSVAYASIGAALDLADATAEIQTVRCFLP